MCVWGRYVKQHSPLTNNFVFYGPSGSGKTDLCRDIANHTGVCVWKPAVIVPLWKTCACACLLCSSRWIWFSSFFLFRINSSLSSFLWFTLFCGLLSAYLSLLFLFFPRSLTLHVIFLSTMCAVDGLAFCSPLRPEESCCRSSVWQCWTWYLMSFIGATWFDLSPRNISSIHTRIHAIFQLLPPICVHICRPRWLCLDCPTDPYRVFRGQSASAFGRLHWRGIPLVVALLCFVYCLLLTGFVGAPSCFATYFLQRQNPFWGHCRKNRKDNSRAYWQMELVLDRCYESNKNILMYTILLWRKDSQELSCCRLRYVCLCSCLCVFRWKECLWKYPKSKITASRASKRTSPLFFPFWWCFSPVYYVLCLCDYVSKGIDPRCVCD